MSKIRLLNGAIDLAIIDLGLPDKRGDVLVNELRVLYPHLPVLIASGYGEGDLRHRLGGNGRLAFVGKPYTQDDLRKALAGLRAR